MPASERRESATKLIISNGPGSTFLPPQIVECFQSFSIEQGSVTACLKLMSLLEVCNLSAPGYVSWLVTAVYFALIMHWKQISSALTHSAYVCDTFSYLDP